MASIPSSPASESTGCFQYYTNIHNKASLEIGDTFSFIKKIKVEDDDSTLSKIAKIFALVLAIIPLGIAHLGRALYNRITCCGQSTTSDQANKDAVENSDQKPGGQFVKVVQPGEKMQLEGEETPPTTPKDL